ncbi:tannase/feruloyl esterase family alpha/beta hydrolase [Mucilaginibacter auburnensis]|uniref:Feruloyl esterase n=1 Tax=Mucilaginibacter auburnensis TaxID=1457233 RepID=A0A2H9VPP4_9SPHI|nr:tannase/feruloyl esterase family alpha/beta hydrolase [Mucilaginibacter auburnensis]PJJ80296.1 feruloyl esterase [Mucilaginibacter auburnensis]
MIKPVILKVILFILIAGPLFGQINTSNITITKADLEKAGRSIPASAIGEPVGSVVLYEPRWVEATGTMPAHGIIEGSIMPVDPKGWPINFRVILPSNWSLRGMQQGGGGMNGTIGVSARGTALGKGFVLYGSDSGHQAGGMGPANGPNKPLATGPAGGDEWALNDEAVKNLAYMQMKKTHDAAMVIMERVYGKKPVYNYYVGTSQGGREALTVAQRYPADYDGIIANVPILNNSTLMLAPVLVRIQEKPLDNWVTLAKVKAITAEFLRQCDALDGIADGMINNYMAARAIFNVKDGVGPKDPWKALRTPNGLDPNPADTSVNAKLTNGQIKTLEFMYSPYTWKAPLANGVRSFGMWLPNTSPADFGLIANTRFKGQEGAPDNARLFTHLGIAGVTGFLMQDLKANSLDYVEDGKWTKRRQEISTWLDATNPDLAAFYKRGGKMIITSGLMDNLASDGAQLDYYQSLIDKMGRQKVDDFARLFVVPHGGHGLSGKGYNVNGEGKGVKAKNIAAPNGDDNLDLLVSWVEKKQAPAKTLVVDEKGKIGTDKYVKGYLLCSYPNYPQYTTGAVEDASSYVSASPDLKSLK